MKNILSILFLLFVQISFGQTTYYVAANGSDANNGTSSSTPWQTISKVNGTTFNSGDVISFRGGDTFYGTITINSGGTSASPITITSYGTGQATISGLSNITSWTNKGGNIWESTSAATTLSTLNMVIENGVNTPMGRWPNSGWNNIDSYSGNTSITSSTLTGSPNWTGATVVLRKEDWVIDKGPISNQSGSTITYSGTSGYNPKTNGMFFIQNDSLTLDTLTEWYFNPSTKKLRIYSTSSPTNIVIPTLQNLFNFSGSGYFVISNINASGSNDHLIVTGSSTGLKVNNSNISYAGNDAIHVGAGSSVDSVVVYNTTITQVNNDGIYVTNMGSKPFVKLTYNTVKDVAMFAGSGSNGDNTYHGIDIQPANNNCSYNRIDSIGYNGISFNAGGAGTVNYNFITHYGMQKLDGGGIYCANMTRGYTVDWNTLMYSWTAYSPTPTEGDNGIYFDTHSTGAEASHNTIAFMEGSGFHFTDADSISLTYNTVYKNGGPDGGRGWALLPFIDTSGHYPFLAGARITNNIFWSVGNYPTAYPDNMMRMALSSPGDSTKWGNIDSNRYVNPLDPNHLFNIQIDGAANGNGWQNLWYSLPQWQSSYHYDAHSTGAPKTTTDTTDMKFLINPTPNSSTVSLPYNYMDANGTTYNGSITIPPYSSAVLIKNGAITGTPAPTISVSPTSQSISVSTASVSATATWASGHSGTYQWTQTSGATATIASPTSASTTISGLTTGTYQFTCTAKQDDNQTASATLTITVTIPVAPPTVSVTNNQTITVSTTTVAAAATWANGHTGTYSWTGTGGVIGTPTSASTTISQLTNGTYQFTCTVRQDDGQTATGVVTVTVNIPHGISNYVIYKTPHRFKNK